MELLLISTDALPLNNTQQRRRQRENINRKPVSQQRRQQQSEKTRTACEIYAGENDDVEFPFRQHVVVRIGEKRQTCTRFAFNVQRSPQCLRWLWCIHLIRMGMATFAVCTSHGIKAGHRKKVVCTPKLQSWRQRVHVNNKYRKKRPNTFAARYSRALSLRCNVCLCVGRNGVNWAAYVRQHTYDVCTCSTAKSIANTNNSSLCVFCVRRSKAGAGSNNGLDE